MLKVLVQVPCPSCKGKAYLPTSETAFISGWKFLRHKPCPQCKGSGRQIKWLDLTELARLLEEIADDKPSRKGLL